MKDIYETYGIKQVINASGKMTILGGSRVNETIVLAIKDGATNFFEIKDLLDKTGQYLADLIGVESCYIVNSASGGIAQSVAASIAKDNLKNILNINNEENLRREIVICKGHNVDYGTPIEVTIKLGGGKVVEAGYANVCTLEHVESQINDFTAALIYVKSHHCVQKGMPDIKGFIDLGHQYNLPVIVDAAAEEDLIKYYNLGADVVVYSGTKAIEGPTSGLLIGKADFINLVKLQNKGIGRVMKVGKESILGLTSAITFFLNKDKLTLAQQEDRLIAFNKRLNNINGVTTKCVQDSAGRIIVRSEISFDESILKINAIAIAEKLKQGNLRIYTRDYRANEGKIEIDIRDVSDDELILIVNKIEKIIKGENYE